MIRSIEALDRLTVRFTFCEPQPAFLEKVAFPNFGIYPTEWLERWATAPGEVRLEAPIGTGPYLLKQWLKGERIELASFPEYWGGEPSYRRVIVRWNLDAVQRFIELQVGLADGIDSPDAEDLDAIRADANLQLILRPPLSVLYLGMNRGTPPLDDARVRQAIALALNREQLVQNHFPQGYQVASYFTPCAIPYACLGEPWYVYDPERARALLADAGYEHGFALPLYYREVVAGYLPYPKLVAQEIKNQLEQNLGLRIRLQALPSEEFLEAADAGALEGLYLLGWGADFPHVINFLDVHFGSEATLQFGPKIPELVDLLNQARLVDDESLRAQYYQLANEILRLEVPAIPLVHAPWISHFNLATGFRRQISGAHASPMGFENFSILSEPTKDTFIWIQTTEPLSLYCADESDVDTLRICAQIVESLYAFTPGEATVYPALAKECIAEAGFSAWLCHLRDEVKFHDGSELDANDVVLSWWVQWQESHLLRGGRSGSFYIFKEFWGAFLP